MRVEIIKILKEIQLSIEIINWLIEKTVECPALINSMNEIRNILLEVVHLNIDGTLPCEFDCWFSNEFNLPFN